MTLEERVAALEERLEMEAGLRASGDRDQASLARTARAQHHLIQALAITQSEHTDLLRAHGDAIEALRTEHGAKLNQIITMLGRLLDGDDRDPSAG